MPNSNTPPESDAPESLAQIKRTSVRGGGITAATQGITGAINLLSTVVLARLLSPEEYGVLAMVVVFTVFAGLFSDLGLSSSTVQRRHLSHELHSTLYWVNVAAGAILTLAVIAISPLVARFYGRPELQAVTICLAFKFLIGSFSTQQAALLVRQMRYGRRAIATVGAAIATFVITLILALQGFSYWALVFGTLGGSVVMTVLLNTLSGWRPGPPRRGTGVRETLRFGMNLTGFQFVNYFSRNLDNILIGKFAGADALGLYSRAYNLLMFPIINLRGPINAVAFPAMSRLQNRPEEFRSYYCTIVSVLSLTSMPLVGYLFVTSEPLILLALGEQWLPASQLFSILAVAAFLQTPSGFRGTVLMSMGMGRRQLMQGLYSAVVTCTGFVVGIQWGALGVACAYAVTSLLMTYPMHVYCLRGTPVRTGDFFRTIAPPALAALSAAAVTYQAREYVIGNLNLPLDLILSGLVYWSLYVILLLIHPRSRSKVGQALQFLRRLRLNRKPGATAPGASAAVSGDAA